MSTAYPYEPLRAVPALDPQRRRFALLLHLKNTLLRARDAATGAVTAARSFVAGLVGRLHLQVPLGWLRRVASRLGAYVSSAAGALGHSGMAATAGMVLASPTARRVLVPLLQTGASAGGRLVQALGRGTDRVLRCLGRPGHAAADRLQTRFEDAYRWLTQVAHPVLRRTGWLVDPAMPQMRALARLARSYLLHRVCTLAVRRRLLRLLLEAVLIPVAVNSGLGARLGQVWGRARFDSQAEAHLASPVTPGAPDQEGERPGDPGHAAGSGGAAAAQPTDEKSAEAEPLNRAQRRARQQQQARNRRRPN